jgi:hypothetical protein
MLNHFSAIILGLTITMFILLIFTGINAYQIVDEPKFEKKSVMEETVYHQHYSELAAPSDAVVIYPIFTQSAYDWNGIHDFNLGRCDTCSTVKINDSYQKRFASSGNAYSVLEFLGYDIIDDIYLDQNPQTLSIYKKVIVLHNEFVTENEFFAITSHPNVIYLYPNSLSSEITADYIENTITLVKGPGYPEKDRKNGFNWEFDNSEYFSDWECKDWKFYKIKNGHMLNCYPEQYIMNDAKDLLLEIKNLE